MLIVVRLLRGRMQQLVLCSAGPKHSRKPSKPRPQLQVRILDSHRSTDENAPPLETPALMTTATTTLPTTLTLATRRRFSSDPFTSPAAAFALLTRTFAEFRHAVRALFLAAFMDLHG